jgi:hypothetical protein
MAAAPREYDEVVVLWEYLYTHYKDRLTETEQKAGRVIIFDGNCPLQSAGGNPEREAEIRFEWGSTDPSVFGALAAGKRPFMEQAAARVLERNGSRIVVNRCPVCGKIARTPHAKQCRWCRHDWH